jgi:branched-chain amino acid aminotransferase
MANVYYHGGQWFDENPMILGPLDHAFWMATTVFDGARAFDGLAPDLDLHCRRLVDSASKMMLAPTKDANEIEDLCRQGIKKLPKDRVYYVRPMFYATEGMVVPVPESTDLALVIYDVPFPGFDGFSAKLSEFRRPSPDTAPTFAKASCLYPNGARALKDARSQGFNNAVMLDPWDNVAEFASANLWIVRDGVVQTPKPNGTFLNGITKQRVAALLAEEGYKIEEVPLSYEDVLQADEIFSTGNYGKVMPCTRLDDKTFPMGPVFKRAKDLYFEYANTTRVF